MNSERRRDPSPEASAERLIDQLLRQRLRAGQGAPPAGACLEPGTLAAWLEGSLAGEELAAAESHSAGCERCQAMLAAMVQTEPAVTPRRWWQSLTARWVVPVAAVATAAALWISVAPDGLPRAPVPSSEADSAAARSASIPTQTERAPGTAPPSIVPSPSIAPPPRAAEERSALADGVQTPDALRKNKATPGAKAAGRMTEDLQARRDRAEPGPPVESLLEARKEAQASPASPPSPPPAAELNAQGRSSAPLRSAEPARDRKQEGSPGPPLPAPPASVQKAQEGRPASAPLVPAVGQATTPSALATPSFRSARVRSIDIVSPDPAIRWQAGDGGLVRRSVDGGVTWVVQPTGTTLDLTAGSSPARAVCWLAGRSGVVLLSIDGKTWQRRAVPEVVDLVAVSATDAKTATVTTSDGRRFSTTDGGTTWSSSLLQESPAAPFYQ